VTGVGARGLVPQLGLALVVGLVAGCAAPQADRMKSLRTSVEAYNTAFRWKNYHRAATYLPNDLRTAFVTYFDEDSSALHVEGVEVLKVDLQSEKAAEVTVRYRFLKLPSVVVERKVVVQSWHYLDGAWVLETEEPSLVDYSAVLEPSEPDDDDEARAPSPGWSTPESWDPDADD